MTTNHPAHGPVSLERLHQIREILSKAAAQSDGGNLGYAMADAVKVIDEVMRIPEKLPCPVHLEPGLKFGKGVPTSLVLGALRRRADYYAELEAMTPEQRAEHDAGIAEFKAMLGGGFRDLSQPVDPQIAEYEKVMLQAGNSTSKCSLRDGIEAIRNSGIPVDVDKIQSECEADNHTEQHLDMVGRSGCANEKVDCRLTFDQWLSQQNEPIDVDCGCVTTEAFYHWLRVAYEASNSPVLSPIDHGYRPDCECSGCIATARICEELAANPPVTPDTWIPVSERMPEGMTDVHISNGHDVGQGWWDGDSWQTQHDYYSVPGDVTHWMSLPAAPQQEVKP
ncbi:DUF551 domain-containing protein [Citrobacter freundii]|nr:DUF551 domain-containing protein [Citrobacter freundii]